MGVMNFILAAAVLAPTVLAQSPVWGQCGGTGWTGATTCASGSTCVFSNPYYSQCLPGKASSSSTPPVSTVSSTSSTSSSSSSSIKPISTSSTTLVSSVSSTKASSSTSSSTSTGTALPAILWATDYSGTVSTLTFSQSGSSYSLTSSSQTTCGSQPSWLTYDPATKILYCVDEFNYGGTLSTYNVGTAGALSQAAKITILNNGVHTALYGGANGDSYLAIAHYQTSQFETFALPITSSSKALQSFKYTLLAPGTIPSRQDAPHPHMALLDPTGTFMLIPDLGADTIRIYSIATSTGLLTSCGNYTATAGSGPRHGSWFVPGSGTAGTTLYIGNELSNTISAFAVTYTGSCLSLTLSQNVAPYPGGKIPAATTPNGVKVGEVHVKGSTLLTSNRADNSLGTNLDSMSFFELNPTTGAFAFQNLTSAFGSYPRTFVINKAGNFVAIGNQNSGTVAIVKRDPVTGVLGDLAAKVTAGATGTDGNGGLSSVIWME